MRKFIALLIIGVSLGVTCNAGAGAVDDAYAAYKSGDYASALSLLRPLSKQGNAIAQFVLGLMYAEGQGVPKDNEEATRLYRLAADQGNADAQYNLGLMYDNGQGVPQDDKEAAKWYRLAAEQDKAAAQYNLGLMYDHGHKGYRRTIRKLQNGIGQLLNRELRNRKAIWEYCTQTDKALHRTTKKPLDCF